MLLLFHSLYILCVRLLKLQRNKRLLQEIVETRRDIEEEVNRHTTTFLDAELNLKFDPPVYKQRYEAVLKILLDDRWRSYIHKIVDFGCAEFGLFHLIRTLYGLTEVLEVDIDEKLLREYLFRLRPRTVDFINRRPQPLTVKVYSGSVAEPDPILRDVDVVVAVELIEHLYPDVLDALPYNIFCYIHPKLVIVTTPNADFNVFFKNFNTVRHYDHKFEWSREQFQDWANNITSRFPVYTVSFIGIGSPPEGATDRGYCSQMALFVRQDPENNLNCGLKQLSRNARSVYTTDSEEINPINDVCGDCVKEPNFGICTYYSYSEQTIAYERSDDNGGSYKLIETIEYPYEERDPEEVVMYDVLYRVSILGQVNGRYYSYDKDRAEVPLQRLIEWHSDGPFISESELRTILERAGYRVEECTTNDGENPVLCVIYEPVMEHSSSPNTESDPSDFQGNDNYQAQELNYLSDWDEAAEDENSSAKLREAIKLQASEVVGEVFNDLETEQIRDKPIETKVKFVMTKVMEAGTSRNETKTTRKHKDSKTETILQNASSKMVTTSQSSKEPTAGTSKKRKKSKKGEEDEVVEDVKELTECILRNSLNRVEDVAPGQAPQVAEVIEEMNVQVIEEAPVVENGDLANNNRDVEGNNCAAEGVNNENVAVENNAPVEIIRNEDYQNRNEDPANQAQEEENRKSEDDESDDDDDIELTFASREALFDPNSKQDLLEDFEIPPSPISEASQLLIDQRVEENMHGPFDVVLLGVSMHASEEQPPEPFPLWLLHLLGAEVLDNDHTEPHFYCQGDGLGVHPSVVEVDVETSSSDSSNNSNDDAESEHTALESETVSLPEDAENAAAQTAVQATQPSAESQTNTKEINDQANTKESNNQANGKENDNDNNRKESDSHDEFFDSKEEEQPSTSKGA